MSMTQPTDGQNWSNFALFRMSSYGFGMVGFVLTMDTVILPVLVKAMAPGEWKNSYLAALGFSGLVIAGILQPLVGRFSDKTRSPLGRRIPYMLWGGAFVSLAMLALGFAPDYWTLLAVWLFLQANFNIGYGPYLALILDLVPQSRVGVASSIKILSDAIGSLVLISLCSTLIGRFSDETIREGVWLSLGIIAAVVVSVTLISTSTVRPRETVAKVTDGVSTLVQGSRQRLHPQLIRFVLSRLLIMTAITAFPTFGLYFLEEAVGLSNPTQALGTMILVIGGSLALSIYPAGWVADRIGRKPVVMFGATGAALSSVCLMWASDATGVLVTASFLGASIGTLLTSNWAMANDLGTRGREALHMGIINLATTGGSAVSKVMGPGIDLLNQKSDGAGYQALLITSALLFVLGALMLMPLKTEHSDAFGPAMSSEETG